MREELDKRLCEKYPKIFADRHADKRETCMCWGFSCGDGWFDLIDKLCNLLQWNTDKNRYPQVLATQVKEKFGTLRFYYSTGYDEDDKTEDSVAYERIGQISGAISFAETMSSMICEECGAFTKHGVKPYGGWYRSLCEGCAEKRSVK
jgi:hypothetical protein